MPTTSSTSHATYSLHVHLVFVTKYRHKVFTDEHLTRLEAIFREVCTEHRAELVEFNGEDNHVHLLVFYPPQVALSRLVKILKGRSSRYLRQEFPPLERHYWRAKRLWTEAYFAGSCGGAPITVLKQYIQNQTRPTR